MNIKKFYIRHREGYPETIMQDYSRRGFWELGIETVSYEWIDDISEMKDLGSTVGLSGYIGDIHRALSTINKSIPKNIDYPIELEQYLGRKIWSSTLAEVRSSTDKVFVKPKEQKLFTGFVWENDQSSRMKIITQHDDTEVLCSDPIDIVAEYRSFILDNKVLDCKIYKGDWSSAPSRILVEQAVVEMKHSAPRAYTLDWGITSRGGTVLIEMNDGFAFGHYGLDPVSYAKMLAARWEELTT